MSAVMSRPAADFYTSTDTRSVDELDAAIGRLVRQMNADSYRMLVLVREFDDRFGWKKWSFKSCAEWLAWRCEHLRCRRRARRCARRTRCDRCPRSRRRSQQGRLSYSKVRALTRVAQMHDEDCCSRMRSTRRCRRSRSAAGRFATSRRIRASRAARVGEPVADDVARRRARPDAAYGRGADRGGRADRRGRSTAPWPAARSRRTSIPTPSPSQRARRGARSRPMRWSPWSKSYLDGGHGSRGRRDGGSLSGGRARRREIPHGRDGLLGSADRDGEAAPVRLQLGDRRRG